MAVPTSTMSFSTTCLVVSQPASTSTYVYSSGQVGAIPPTTYTAPHTIFYTRQATVDARCFTLGPGQTVPPAVSYFGASCTTVYRPGSRETTTHTYTPGQPLVAWGETIDVYTGTTTSYATATYTYPPETKVYCEAIPDVHNPATCDTVSPLTWTALILTFITMHLTWWLFDVPLLWKKQRPATHDDPNDPNKPNLETQTTRDAAATATATATADADANDRLGPSGFFLTIAWACLRANAPGCAAVYALMAGRDTSEYAAMYYLGVRRLRDGRAPQFTAWKLATSIGTDVLSLVVVGVTVYQACTLPGEAPRRFGASMWAYPSLPTALIGLCFMAGRYWFPRTGRAAVGLVVMVVGVVVVVGVALALLLWRFDSRDGTWFVSVLFYGMMAVPAVLVNDRFVGLAVLYGCFGRIGGVTLAAFNHLAGGQPYCKMPGLGFPIVYLTLGLISAVLALVAIRLYQRDITWWPFYIYLGQPGLPASTPGLERRIGERQQENREVV